VKTAAGRTAAKTAGSKQGKRAPQRIPVTLSRDEREAFVAQIGSSDSTTVLRNKAMVAVMLGAGLRVSEVVALRGVDVDAGAGIVTVRGGKGDKDRTIPVKPDTAGALSAWGERRKSELGLNGRHPFFVSLRSGGNGAVAGEYQIGDELSDSTVQDLVARLAREAKIEKRVTPHTLRHTFATIALNDWKLSLRDVQKLLGHASVATTEIYTHVNEEELRLRVQGTPAAEQDPVAVIMAALAGLSKGEQVRLAKQLTGG